MQIEVPWPLFVIAVVHGICCSGKKCWTFWLMHWMITI